MTTPTERLDAALVALQRARQSIAAAQEEYDAAVDALDKIARDTGATQFKGERFTFSVGLRRNVHAGRFLEWALAHRPDEVETTQSVRASYRRAFLDSLTWDSGEAVTQDGEVVDFVDRTRFVSVKPR